MQRSFGLASDVTAAGQLQKRVVSVGVQPLPPGSPGRATAGQLGIVESDPLTFFVIGDTGGVVAPAPQNAVSTAVDTFHGGSATMGTALDQAFNASGRVPELVLSGHVHDYQRFTRTFGTDQVLYVVSGNGGYHNLHQLASDATPGARLAPDVVFEFGDASQYGFLQMTVSGGKISGEYVGVKPGTMPDGSDAHISQAVDRF